MANNRTEVKANIQANIQPTVTTEIHRSVLDDNFANDALFKKAVAGDVKSIGAPVPLIADFSTYDKILVDFDVYGGQQIVIQGVERGQRVTLQIKKGLTDNITFNTGTIVNSHRIQGLTTINYRVENIEGVYNITQLNGDLKTTFQSSDWVFPVVTLVDYGFCDFNVVGNMLHIQAKMEVATSATDTISVSLDYSSLPVQIARVGENIAAICNYHAQGVVQSGYLREGSLIANVSNPSGFDLLNFTMRLQNLSLFDGFEGSIILFLKASIQIK